MSRAIALSLVPEPAFEKSLRLVLLLNLLDAFYTIAWIYWGWATEANPLMAEALSAGPGVFVLSKVALVTLSVGLLWRHRSHTSARMALIPVALLYAFVAGQHIGVALHII